MQLVMITGVSGAGKASAAKIFEDLGYTVVDNLPPVLLPELVEKCIAVGDQPPAQRLAVVVDTRSGAFFAGLDPALEMVRAQGVQPVLLFFDAADAVLAQRFTETRRRHPLFKAEGILDSIRNERDLLEGIKEIADKVIDTSDLDLRQLRTLLAGYFSQDHDLNQGLTITIVSFGFKYGLPLDADLVFDVRFLINPHYVPSLQPLDGRDAQVEAYIRQDPDFVPFLDKLTDLMAFSVPQYVEEGKAYLTVAIGCTGGRHRSVLTSEKLAEFLRTQGYHALVQHRDVEKRG